jgi:hypothetical protein
VDAPIGLSLPEAFVILEGTRADGHEAVFLAMVDMVASGNAKLVFVHGDAAFSFEDTRAHASGPVGALGAVLSTCETAKTADGTTYVLTDAAAPAFALKWGSANAFIREAVWPALVERGLVSRAPNLLDSVFVVDAWHLTPEGQAERQRLLTDLAAEPHWKEAPATALLNARGSPVLSDESFDALDVLEDLITPGDPVLGNTSSGGS